MFKHEVLAVMLCGPGRASHAIEALESVDWVDGILLIDTADGENDTLDAVVASGITTPIEVVKKCFSPCRNFGVMRSFAIDSARDAGADWMLIIDTDEVMHWGDTSPRHILRGAKSPVVNNRHLETGYMKNRFIRVSDTQAKYVGLTHEYLEVIPRCFPVIIDEWRFSEKAKSREELDYKFSRDFELLEEQIEMSTGSSSVDVEAKISTCQDPMIGRWLYYYAECSRYLGHPTSRVVSFHRLSADAEKHPENSAWSLWQIGQLYWCEYDREQNKDRRERLLEKAKGAALEALGKFPQSESAWLLARIAYETNGRQVALPYARAALEIDSSAYRMSFRAKEALAWTHDLLLWIGHPDDIESSSAYLRSIGRISRAPAFKS